MPTADVLAPPFIELVGVQKTYIMGATPVVALDHLDLTVNQGTFVAVVGRSGSGKSTLLHLLAAMERPTSGTIRVGPWSLASLDANAQAQYRREMVGMIFQKFNLIPSMSAEQNVALPLLLAGHPKADRHDRVRQALHTVGLDHRRGHRPAELSGGEQQRVAIARALVLDPPVLLADEPTGNLDSTTSGQIVDLLAQLHAEVGKTILIVTHHPDEVAHVVERVVSLHDGRLVPA